VIISIAIFLAVLVIDLWTDLHRYFAGKEINHARGLILRIIGLIPSVYFLPHDRAIGAVIEALLYMTLFNGLWGVFIGHGWFYLGHTAWIDRQMRRFGVMGYVFQYGILLALILIYVL
jgi:hypothetical protein